MKKAVSIIMPPLIGLVFVVLSAIILYMVVLSGVDAFDFSYGFKIGIVALPLYFIILLAALFGAQALLVTKILDAYKVIKVTVIALFVILLGLCFSLYVWSSSFKSNSQIGAAFFVYVSLFYCLGNMLTLYIIQRKNRTKTL